MKTKKFTAFLLAASALFVFTACDKDDEDPQPTKMELLTRAEWKGNDILFDGLSARDDTAGGYNVTRTRLKFNPNGTFTNTHIGVEQVSGNWRFISNETRLVIEDDTLSVAVLTLSDLHLTSSENRAATAPPAFEIRYIR